MTFDELKAGILNCRECEALFGFERRTIKEGDANRAGILAAIRQFIAATPTPLSVLANSMPAMAVPCQLLSCGTQPE